VTLPDVPVRTRLPRSVRRTQLLAAARMVFVAHGYHAAGMDEIAERAGVSKPVLYQHFPSKLDLYLALLDQHSAELLEAVRAALSSTTDNKLRVAATIAAYFRFVDREDEPFRLVFESDLTNDASVRDRVDAVSNACAQAIAEVIAEDTGLPAAEAELLAVALAGMAQVTARYWISTGRRIPQADADRLIAQLSWRGIRGFPKWDGTENEDALPPRAEPHTALPDDLG
jgi:AcrR family transcriptional regulator